MRRCGGAVGSVTGDCAHGPTADVGRAGSCTGGTVYDEMCMQSNLRGRPIRPRQAGLLDYVRGTFSTDFGPRSPALPSTLVTPSVPSTEPLVRDLRRLTVFASMKAWLRALDV